MRLALLFIYLLIYLFIYLFMRLAVLKLGKSQANQDELFSLLRHPPPPPCPATLALTQVGGILPSRRLLRSFPYVESSLSSALPSCCFWFSALSLNVTSHSGRPGAYHQRFPPTPIACHRIVNFIDLSDYSCARYKLHGG